MTRMIEVNWVLKPTDCVAMKKQFKENFRTKFERNFKTFVREYDNRRGYTIDMDYFNISWHCRTVTCNMLL